MENAKLWRQITICLLASGYVFFRLWGISDSCLWFDEIFGMHAAGHSWATINSFVAQDLIHPPLFYYILKIWTSIGGESVLWVRLLPFLLSVLSLGPFLMIFRELKIGFSATAVSLAFLAANGALIKYSQEVRMYSLLMLLSLMSMWLFTRYFVKGKSFWALTLFNILMVYTHYYGWLVVGAEVIAILILQRIKIRQTLMMAAITFAAFVPWLIAVISAARNGSDLDQNIGWIESPGILELLTFLISTVEPFYFRISSIDPISVIVISIPLLMIVLAAKVIYLSQSKTEPEKRNIYLLSAFTLFPLIIAFTASWLLPYSVWGSRHLIIVYAPIAIAAGVFITGVKIIWARNLMIGATIFFMLAGLGINKFILETPVYSWCYWEKGIDAIAEIKPNTPIYTLEDLSAYHAWFAARSNQNITVSKLQGIAGVTEDNAYFIPRGFDGIAKITVNDITAERFWLAYRASAWDERHPPISTIMGKSYKNGQIKSFESVGETVFFVEFVKTDN